MKERAAIRKMLNQNPDTAARLKQLIDDGKITSMDNPALDPDKLLTVVCSKDNGGIDDCVQDRCEGCKELVWVAPSTQAMIVARGHSPLRVICPICWVKEIENDAQAR
jgi:hypothetical protein